MALIIAFVNDGTGDHIEGNYDYAVYINDRVINRGRIENHNRLTGWEGLVKHLVYDLEKEEKRKK